jgi:hypothetical protein
MVQVVDKLFYFEKTKSFFQTELSLKKKKKGAAYFGQKPFGRMTFWPTMAFAPVAFDRQTIDQPTFG